jgi:S1-C subfamily serine protease
MNILQSFLLCPAVVLSLAAGPALAQPTDNLVGSQNSMKLTAVIMALPAGKEWLSVKAEWCARPVLSRHATGGRDRQDLPPYTTAFKAELERAGYKVSSDDNVFATEASAADYQIAAVVTDALIDACVNYGSVLSSGKTGDTRGDGSMKIEWQVYSPIKKQVVARIITNGTAKLEKNVPGGVEQLITASFASNARELASNSEFEAAVSAPKAFARDFVLPDQQGKIVLTGSLQAGPRKIGDATGSVVTILTGTGSGSGFLVSADGYILTDAHVVGDEKNVRVRWSDGLETLATVERASKKRDVAIIKTSARDRAPLALRRGPMTLGQRVYAIGSPGGKTFESTVSSGVVSADRVFDGLRYIQSDTTVSHGSSGGPLLDEKGAVIGLTDLGIPNAGPTGDDGPAGLNLFTPIGDAMDFLNLEQQ